MTAATLPAGAVSGGLTPASGAANRGWRAPVYRAKRGVESSDAGEPRGERDGGHRHHGLVDQPLRALHAPSRRDGRRRRTRVPHEQSAQVAGRHPKHVGEIINSLAIVEESALDEPQCA